MPFFKGNPNWTEAYLNNPTNGQVVQLSPQMPLLVFSDIGDGAP